MDTDELLHELEGKKGSLELARANLRLEIENGRAKVKEIDAELVKVKRLINACNGRKPRSSTKTNKLMDEAKTPLETGI